MKEYKITINTTCVGEDLISDIFWEIGSDGVSIINSNDVFNLYKEKIIWDYIEEKLLLKSEIVVVEGYFYGNERYIKGIIKKLNDLLANLKTNSDLDLGSLEYTYSSIEEKDWREEWKKFYAPIECEKIVIVPEWIKYENINNKKIVKINPGSAFGTGEHETTKMCINLLSSLNLNDKNVLDAGTGSGILALSASMLGAKKLFAIDIDDTALNSCKKNIILNNVNNITLDNIDLTIDSIKDKAVKDFPKFDLIIANITAGILIKLSDIFKKLLKENGNIILSGIIKEREKEVENEYTKRGFTVINKNSLGEWQAFMLK